MSETSKLDARNMLCPLPVIRTQNAVKSLNQGDTLEVTGTDPGILTDIPAWCRINGHQVLDQQNADHEFIITLQVGSRQRHSS